MNDVLGCKAPLQSLPTVLPISSGLRKLSQCQVMRIGRSLEQRLVRTDLLKYAVCRNLKFDYKSAAITCQAFIQESHSLCKTQKFPSCVHSSRCFGLGSSVSSCPVVHSSLEYPSDVTSYIEARRTLMTVASCEVSLSSFDS